MAKRYESDAEAALKRGDKASARNAFIQAKTYYSLARFPSPYRGGSAICPPTMSGIKEESYNKYLECFRRACEFLDAPPETIPSGATVVKPSAICVLPKGASASQRVPAVLVMCGGDMYKEDREKYAEGAMAEGMAALVVDAPGTGQTTFIMRPSQSLHGRRRSMRSQRVPKSMAIVSAHSA